MYSTMVKRKVVPLLFKIGTIAIYLGLIAFLVLQALTPGGESSNISSAVGDKIDSIVTDIQKPETQIVSVTGIEISRVSTSSQSFTEENVSMYVGATGKVHCTVFPANATNPALSYSSSNPDVVTVYSDGKIQAVSAGMAVITVTSQENTSFTDSVLINVFEIAMEGISIQNIPSDFRVDEIYRLSISYTPSNCTQRAVTWQSSDTNVVVVDSSGRLTAIAEGSATITAMSAIDSSISDSVTVTVLPKRVIVVVPVESISLSLENTTGYIGESANILTSFAPAESSDTLVWVSSDESVATVSQNGVVSYHKAGMVAITAQCSTYSGVQNSITITVKEVLSSSIVLQIENLKSVGENAYSMKVGSSGKVHSLLDENATILTVTYTSSDTSIATISADGVIEGIKKGTVTITATTSYDGQTTQESFTLTVERVTFSDNVSNFYYWIRKSFGHFGAFLVLGFFATLSYYFIFPKHTKGKLLSFLVCVIAGFAVAGITEILQLPYFTVGRHCSMKDVWLDFQGYCCSTLTMYAVILSIHFIKMAIDKRKTPSKNRENNFEDVQS